MPELIVTQKPSILIIIDYDYCSNISCHVEILVIIYCFDNICISLAHYESVFLDKITSNFYDVLFFNEVPLIIIAI